jgi:6-phosphogluconolactonase
VVPPIDVRVLEDPASPCAELLAGAAADGGHIAVTGGTTPRRAYERAAELEQDWSRAALWWSDERCVPPEDELSNFRLVKESLLERLPPSGEGAPQVHRMPGERGPHAGAGAYEDEMRATFREGTPRLDLVLLGLGPDAHVASLYPGQATLDVRDRLAVGVEQAGWTPFVPRISLTLPVLNAARRVVILVTGEDKAEAVERAFGADAEPSRDVPASLVRPTDGDLVLLLDEAAASRLPVRG